MKNKVINFNNLKRNVLYAVFCAVLCVGCKPKIEVGQIWIKEYNTDNPFEEIDRETVEILRVSGKWVKYKREGRIGSCEDYLIPVNARRLK